MQAQGMAKPLCEVCEEDERPRVRDGDERQPGLAALWKQLALSKIKVATPKGA